MHQPKDLENIALQWLEAFNARNLDALLNLYADDAEHFSPKLKVHKPETNGLVKGKAALRDWWEGAYLRLPTLNYKATNLTANSNRVFMEYIRTVEGEEDMAVAELFEVKDGKIVFSRVYHG
ncbi:nuclear transport factor 2 family protein [Flavobacterium sp. Sd200]|uniref:nuclear transport factor 2 family protein n=1 Tax=Flavobacterium sp. Sd200 TaxID=2692211 RepID=UPI001369D515|nr:nuclear transport factor 2 family protein [Flavobacterium sp. Sd200]MXN91227.1 nuclear transport factor 2 family protein [Flavobacterium sp. Sd200]